jgi:hypothetical protein
MSVVNYTNIHFWNNALLIADTKEEKFPQINQNSCIFKIIRHLINQKK